MRHSLTPLANLSGGGGAAGSPASVLVSPIGPVPDANAATIVGSLGLTKLNGTILAQSPKATADAHALWPLPAGVAAGGPWTITLAGQFANAPNTNFPVFGINLSTAAVASTVALFAGCYWYSSDNLAVGIWTVDLATQTRPTIFENSNSFPIHTAPMFLRLLNDGTNLLAQLSNLFSQKWRTFYVGTVAATYGGTPTVYGLDNGCVSGSAFAESLTQWLEMKTLPQIAISTVTLNPSVAYTYGTATPHGLATGDSASVNGVAFTGTASVPPNGVFDSDLTVIDAHTFTVPTAATGTFAYTSGGLVTNTSGPN